MLQETYFYGGISIGAGQGRFCAGVEQDPGYAIGAQSLHPLGIAGFIESACGVLVSGPVGSECGKDGNDAWVFCAVQDAAFGDGPESLRLLVAERKRGGVGGKDRIGGGVFSNPEEGLLPGIGDRDAGQFDAPRLRIRLVVGEGHSKESDCEAGNPCPDTAAPEIGDDEPAEHDRARAVNRIETAQELNASEKAGTGNMDETECGEIAGGTHEGRCRGQSSHGSFQAVPGVDDSHENDGRDQSHDLVPVPFGKEEIAMSGNCLTIGRGDGVVAVNQSDESAEEKSAEAKPQRSGDAVSLDGAEDGYKTDKVYAHQRVQSEDENCPEKR